MAYPTNLFSVRLEDNDREAITLKRYLSGRNAALASGNVAASGVIDIWLRLKAAAGVFAETAAFASANPTFITFVQNQKASAQLNVASEFNAMLGAINTAAAWVVDNMPKQDGYVLTTSFGDGVMVDRVFTPAQTAGLRTAIQAVIDTIGD